jgi:hypothetical protein
MSSRLSGRRSSHPLDSHQAGCVSLKQYFEGDQWQGSTTRIDREDGGCADKRPECRFHDCKEPGLIKAFIGRLRGRMGWLGRRSWIRLERPVCRAASETSCLKRYNWARITGRKGDPTVKGRLSYAYGLGALQSAS